MADIFDYLYWRGDLTMEQAPFNEIDAVTLARFSYFPLSGRTRGRMCMVCRRLLKQPEIGAKMLMRDDLRLLRTLIRCRRYRDMQVFAYAERLDILSQTQFAAVTVEVGENTYYVSFRGTDNTLVGWKEDLNMSFGTVPSQKLAVAYLNKIAANLPGQIIVGGHSKGGNLAVYAAAFCKREIQDKITAVYNFDGPGFHEEILHSVGYRRICGRIRSFVPQSSVVGMMLGHNEVFTIVHSRQNGLLQHDVYSWEMERERFSCVQTVTNSSRFVDSTLKHWLAEVEPQKREKFVDAVYSVLLETNATTVQEVGNNKFSNGKNVFRALKKLEKEDRAVVLQALRAFARCAKMSVGVISKPGQK